jgi:peroxidase
MTTRCCLVVATLLAALLSVSASLEFGFYNKTCPSAETIVQQTVAAAFTNNSGVAPALLRMHFHDCFVRVSPHMHVYSSSNKKKSIVSSLFA